MKERELALELGEQVVERRPVDLRRIAVGDGRDAHQGLELGDDPVLRHVRNLVRDPGKCDEMRLGPGR
ncbi:hypothetical protein GCM10009843_38720 [Nocardioides bigeumensis]|uniref:Uncharacterized protein n=1 Tax=Nocardioides bigeumensis TaxID=433657 RepID=A0ABP5KJN0_9ACTN